MSESAKGGLIELCETKGLDHARTLTRKGFVDAFMIDFTESLGFNDITPETHTKEEVEVKDIMIKRVRQLGLTAFSFGEAKGRELERNRIQCMVESQFADVLKSGG